MNAALFLIIGVVVLIVGYIFYGGWLVFTRSARVMPSK